MPFAGPVVFHSYANIITADYLGDLEVEGYWSGAKHGDCRDVGFGKRADLREEQRVGWYKVAGVVDGWDEN